jgi:phosphohistidine phosphatase
MKTLLILRHAKSSWKDLELQDHDRPLNKRRKQDALRMGKLLRREDIIPDLIVSSTAVRAKKTAELVANACKYKGKIAFDNLLYGTNSRRYLRTIEGLSDKYITVLLVGHNPTVEETIEILTNSPDIIMPTCALAQIILRIQKWSDLNNINNEYKEKLLEVWKPKEEFS